MKFGYTIIYVASVKDTLAFYNQAFGFETRFVTDEGDYGELNTGDVVLAFADHSLGEMNLEGQYQKTDPQVLPFGVELGFVTEEVEAAYAKAIAAGGLAVKEPTLKPWGQMVAYLRTLEGTLIELCSPMGS
jgi:lactoylglutathione lyase